MKNIIYLISLIGITSLFNGCAGGYVSVEPTYHAVYSPARPGEDYIWIEGNWYWDNRTHIYMYRDGYWTLPKQGKYYKPGYWNKNRRGYHWLPGGWR